MISVILCMAAFAALYAIKGGSAPYFYARWNEIRDRNAVYGVVLDGKYLSTTLAFVVALIGTADLVTLMGDRGVAEYAFNFVPALLFAAGWLISVAPSMGEEHGAVGDLLGPLPAYKKTERGRLYDVKKALQRGVFMGAAMALMTGYVPYICFSLLFIPCVFFGQELNRLILKTPGWTIAEPLIGAVVFGIPSYLFFTS